MTRHSPRSASTQTDISWDFISRRFIELIRKPVTFLIISHTCKHTHAHKCMYTFLKLHTDFSTSLAGKPQPCVVEGRKLERRRRRRKVGGGVVRDSACIVCSLSKGFTVVHGHVLNWIRPYRCPRSLNVFPNPSPGPLKPPVCDP